MIRMAINARRLKRKFEAVEAAVATAVGEAMELGFQTIVTLTPEDTGFLKASWYQVVGRGSQSHPNPPDAALKARLRYPAGRQAEFTAGYAAQIAQAGLTNYGVAMQVGSSSNIAISSVSWVNDAPYAEGLDNGSLANGLWAGWATSPDGAFEMAERVIRGYLATVNLKLHMR